MTDVHTTSRRTPARVYKDLLPSYNGLEPQDFIRVHEQDLATIFKALHELRASELVPRAVRHEIVNLLRSLGQLT